MDGVCSKKTFLFDAQFPLARSLQQNSEIVLKTRKVSGWTNFCNKQCSVPC